jgi:glycosyltransferase involved in cell wall biosynthesis
VRKKALGKSGKLDSAKYICAFRGRRDYYQVPIALAEAGILEEFITDAYAGRIARSVAPILPERLRQKLDFRFDPSLPTERVRSIWSSTIVEQLRHGVGCEPSVTYAKLDRHFGSAVAVQARRRKCNLLIYSHYAWEAFTQRYQYTPKKVLFQFHPHPDFERRILAADSQKYSFASQSFASETGEYVNDELRERTRDSWKHADLILCASSFTRRSLLEAGAEDSRCKVIPYGIDVPRIQANSASARFTALFVGTGNQRKGLHHLLLAWRQARLAEGSRLVLVCRVIDRSIAALVKDTPSVVLVPGVERARLQELFETSSVLVLPSLVEGFGQVYLEALARGCPVVGTPHTGLPDLCTEGDPIWLTEPGQIDQLVSVLESLSTTLPGNPHVRLRAQACAMRWSWERFRSALRAALQD